MKLFLRILALLFFITAIVTVIFYIQGKVDNVTLAGTCVAFFGIFLNEAAKLADKEKQVSKFFLEESLSGFNHTVELLRDRNNNRLKWISAARILQQSLYLSKKITEEEHKSILQIETDRYRHQLWEILNPNDKHITAAFFYGVRDTSLDICEAAKESSIPKVGELQSRFSSIHNLSEESLFVIWNFMKFPEDYADPLSQKFSKGQTEELRLHHRPLYDYLEHKRNYQSINGKLFNLSNQIGID
ncbi:hypothetical protein [Nostoc sphaeroides]|uniref:Uncharacterized protein n=1 Tax=Nostoc sphaeroides CCNUC1 TaxID=2653204 RepID=A0A5P8WDV8_9NOSO|nr:hypothetical protein [Nostoc sphaeroides]QFS51017.1 hypothetical protein GXM_08511 [Nostoc sphaeroides CCNUC1]